MPLNATTLSGLIETNLKAQFSFPGYNDADLKKLCDSIASAVVSHITSAAVVNVTVATTGTAAAQTGTGTGTVT